MCSWVGSSVSGRGVIVGGAVILVSTVHVVKARVLAWKHVCVSMFTILCRSLRPATVLL